MSSEIGPVRRLAFVSGGLACVGLGGLGLVVPGLPSTVFFIAAAACFSRSHPRLEQWVLGLPKVGPAVRDYRAGLGMPQRAKRWAIASIVVFSTISIVLLGPWFARAAVAVVAAIGVWYVGWRVPTTPADVTRPDVTRPDVTRPDMTRPDVTRPDVTRPDVTRPDVRRPDDGRSAG